LEQGPTKLSEFELSEISRFISSHSLDTLKDKSLEETLKELKKISLSSPSSDSFSNIDTSQSFELPWDFTTLDSSNFVIYGDYIRHKTTDTIIDCISTKDSSILYLSERVKPFFNVYSTGLHRIKDKKEMKILRPLNHKDNNLDCLRPIMILENYHEYKEQIKAILFQRYLCGIISNDLSTIYLINVDGVTKAISMNESMRKICLIPHFRRYFPDRNNFCDYLGEILNIKDEKSYHDKMKELKEMTDKLKDEIYDLYDDLSIVNLFRVKVEKLLTEFYRRRLKNRK